MRQNPYPTTVSRCLIYLIGIHSSTYPIIQKREPVRFRPHALEYTLTFSVIDEAVSGSTWQVMPQNSRPTTLGVSWNRPKGR